MIEEKIKELFGKKKNFCASQGYAYKDFSKKLRTVENRINWLNDFLSPLNLEIKIAPKRNTRAGKNKLPFEPTDAD